MNKIIQDKYSASQKTRMRRDETGVLRDSVDVLGNSSGIFRGISRVFSGVFQGISSVFFSVFPLLVEISLYFFVEIIGSIIAAIFNSAGGSW